MAEDVMRDACCVRELEVSGQKQKGVASRWFEDKSILAVLRRHSVQTGEI